MIIKGTTMKTFALGRKLSITRYHKCSGFQTSRNFSTQKFLVGSCDFYDAEY